jgi:hypothetical protein
MLTKRRKYMGDHHETDSNRVGFTKGGKSVFLMATLAMEDDEIVEYQQKYIDWLKKKTVYDRYASSADMQVGFGNWLLQQKQMERLSSLIENLADALEDYTDDMKELKLIKRARKTADDISLGS